MEGAKGLTGTKRIDAKLLAGGRMRDGGESMLSWWLNVTIKVNVEELFRSCLRL